MNDFDFDVLERRRIARNAKYKKCGSKSKRCPLSTDRMTEKEWKERNGKVLSYQMNEPMSWAQFKDAPAYIQEMYVAGLMEKFNVSATAIGDMLGVGAQTVVRHCKEFCPGVVFRRGNRMTKEDRDAFAKFCGVEDETPQEVDVREKRAIDVSSGDEVPDIVVPVNASGMSMGGFSLHFSGPFDGDMLLNSLAYMLPRGTEAELDIVCRIKDRQ